MNYQKLGNAAILLDLDNLFIGALQDELVTSEKSTHARSVLDAIMGTVHTDHKVAYAYAAAGIPRSNGTESRDEYRTLLSSALICLNDAGFEFTTVTEQTNGADRVLYRNATFLCRQAEITDVYVCTGDGGKSFSGLIRNLRAAQKSVHLVSYDKTPTQLRLLVDSMHLIAPTLRCESSGECKEHATNVTSILSGPTSRPEDINYLKHYREAVSSLAKGATASNRFQQNVISVCGILNYYDAFDSSMGGIIRGLTAELSSPISREELHALIIALEENTETFTVTKSYRIFKVPFSSHFLPQVQPVSA